MITKPSPQSPLKIGTRGSPLALAQAHETRERLSRAWDLPDDAFEVVIITTTGDRIQDKPLKEFGGKGLFTKEIEEALLRGDIDIAVHSMKDMPVAQPIGLSLDHYLPREDVRDALVSYDLTRLADVPAGSKLGTSSLRRRAQILARHPDLRILEFRGSVQTRLRKLKDGMAGATFLAQAGLNRLGLKAVPATPIETDEMLPAVAQGAIGIERREDDMNVGILLEAIHDMDTGYRLDAEREFLATLDGSCQTPIAGLATLDGGQLELRGEILRPDGSEVISGQRRGDIADGAEMGADLARELWSKAGPNFFG